MTTPATNDQKTIRTWRYLPSKQKKGVTARRSHLLLFVCCIFFHDDHPTATPCPMGCPPDAGLPVEEEGGGGQPQQEAAGERVLAAGLPQHLSAPSPLPQPLGGRPRPPHGRHRARARPGPRRFRQWRAASGGGRHLVGGAASSPPRGREEAALRRGGAAEGWEGGLVPKLGLGRLGWVLQPHPVRLVSGDRALT